MGLSIPGADAVGQAFAWAKDQVSNAADHVGNVVDTASDAIDTAGAVGGAVRDTVAHGIERGADIASEVFSTVVTPNGIDRKLQELTAPVDTLKPGESVSFNAGVEVNAAVSASGGAAIDVTRNDDDTYTIGGSVDGALGGKISDTGIDFGGTVRVELSADNAGQARRIVAALAKGGGLDPKLAQAGGLELPLDKPVIGPPSPELQLLSDHLSAVELSGSVGAGVGARLGLTTDLDAGAQADAQADAQAESTLRLEFEDGRPTAAVTRTTIQANGDLGAGVVGLLPEQAVTDVKTAAGVDPRDVLAGGDATVGITVENRVALASSGAPTPGWKALSELGTNGEALPGVVRAGDITSKVTVSADATSAAGRGTHAEVSLDGLNPSDVAGVVRGLAQGDVGAAVKSFDARIHYEVQSTRVQDEGLDADFVVGGVHATRSITRVDASHSGSIAIGGPGKAGSSAGPASAADRVDIVSVDDAGSVPYDPDFRSTPDAIVNPPNPADKQGPWIAFEQHVGAEVGRSLGVEGDVRALYRSNSRLPAQRNTIDPQLLHAPKINAGGGGSGTRGSGGAGEPFRRPDWVVVQEDHAVLAVEATLDSSFQVKNVDGGIHKVTQLQGTLDALVNQFGQGRAINYVIRSPDAPGPEAQRALDDVERLQRNPKYANVTVTWVAG